ncbi:MAG: Beta-lactamase class C-like and penicillin binding proteins (PBPs) superfamily [uncultured Frankineae bacterium]|uniref:Beta-lactamase class C-like and penicillin binding proteins (PBPs) superfamily n=1 Tax=uncultured Frankineae bacterium TaxID=437475 RepID=A0A6J4KZH5_9ACTN|nr:MAG: Beta-lactamase class C-like and penicillin binding proteins (PBPs) superfamily [uncultured Frankineae bacterium]
MLTVDEDPGAVGVDAQRLARIDARLASYVDEGRLAGWQVLVTRRGQTVHSSTCGSRDLEAGLPVEPDTLWRIYSMTKPVTAVVAMQLYEQGLLRLNDELSRYLPEFADMRVLVGGNADQPKTVPAVAPVRLWHLLSHTAGLTYAFTRSSVLDEMYRGAKADPLEDPDADLAQMCERWGALPLMFEPGTAWNYSVATDVLGRVVEVVTGQTLEEAFAERVLGPLGMSDTRWWVDAEDASRLAALYVPHPGTGRALRHDAMGATALRPPKLLSGGGGLISTAADYARFTSMLVRGGELDGVRLLGPRTLAYMTRNHLPGGGSLTTLGRGQFAETAYDGIGFGLGFGVSVDPVATKVTATPGEFTWGGLASTAFWVDPVEQLTAHFFTQLVPSSTYPIRTELRQLVYAALVD